MVDTGPLLAAFDSDEPNHVRCMEALERADLRLVLPTMVVAEATYMIQRKFGAKAEVGFLRGVAEHEIEAPDRRDWKRIGDLVEQYSDLPLGGTDASVVALAERLGATQIITLDRRHFSVVRPAHTETFELLPA